MKKIHYSWKVCIGCAALLFCTSGLSVNAFSIYLPYIRDINSFTNTQSSTLILLRNLFGFIGMLTVGRFYRRFSLRTGMTVAGGLIVLGYGVYALARSYPTYCLGSCIVGIGYGFGSMVPITILLGKWFVEKRRTALGACSAVTGLSTLGTTSLIAWTVERYGLRTAFFSEAAVIAILVYISYRLIRNSPHDIGLRPYGIGAEVVCENRFGPGLEKRDWIILIPAVTLLGAMMGVPYAHLTVLVTGEGFSEQMAALGITVSGLCLIFRKLIYGRLGDSLGAYRCNYIFGPMVFVGLAMCCFIGLGQGMMFAALAVYSLGLSATSVGISSWVGDLENEKNYSRSVQIFQIMNTAGSFSFASLPGMIADRFGGSYVPFYAAGSVVSFFAIAALQYVFHRKTRAAVTV